MTILENGNRAEIKPMQGITTASEIFDEISISVVRPKPQLIKKRK
jgi:hypothetical protein